MFKLKTFRKTIPQDHLKYGKKKKQKKKEKKRKSASLKAKY